MNFLEAWLEYEDLSKLQIKKDKKQELWHIHFNNGGENYERQDKMILALMGGVSVRDYEDDYVNFDTFYSVSKEDKRLHIWCGEAFDKNESTIKRLKTFDNEVDFYIYFFDKFSSFDGSFPTNLGIVTPDALFHKSMMEGNNIKLWGYNDISGRDGYGEFTYLVSEKLPNGNHRFYEVWHPQPDYSHNGKIYTYFQITPIDECTPRWTAFLQDSKAGKNVKENAETWELTAEEYEAKKEGGFKIGYNFTPL
jgi:hypothetical protein